MLRKMAYGDTDSLAYNSSDTNELININLGVPSEETHGCNNTNYKQFTNRCDNDIDINLPSKTYCKNYSIEEFQSLKTNKTDLKIFHNNINGLENKHDLLQNFLANNTINVDIIAITETSLNTENINFNSNIGLEGYRNYSIPSSSNKGGSTSYAERVLDILKRTDLNITNDDYESIWIEIKNEKSRNIIIGSIYRHACINNDNFNNFLKYVEFSLNNLTKENKEIYLCGDFNIDLLKKDEITNYKEYTYVVTLI